MRGGIPGRRTSQTSLTITERVFGMELMQEGDEEEVYARFEGCGGGGEGGVMALKH